MLPRGQGELQGNQPAHRVADHMRRLPSLRIHEHAGILSELLNGEWRADGLASADAAIVVGKAAVIHGEVIDLRIPAAAVNSDALNEENRRTVAANLIRQRTAEVFDDMTLARMHRG